ncbi:MAG: DUF4244 domain-containing protein [Acidimicrobiia bacterium]|nr:DUF4244 domain-containing protein [Acidimicrobiia bacterium]
MTATALAEKLGSVVRHVPFGRDSQHPVAGDGLLRLDATDPAPRIWPAGDAGQSTTEYAFVLVVVAVIGLALYAVGPEKIQSLFSSIVDKLSGDAQAKIKLRMP